MTKTIKILAVLIAIIFISSFTDNNSDKFIGTFGVSVSDPSQIKLTLNADHSFNFQDFSVSDKKVFISGSWTQKGNKVILSNNDSKTKFHNVWTFANNGQVAKSRKGLTFYRLCKITQNMK